MTRNPWTHAVGLAVGVSALLSLVLLAFAWPTSEIEPRDLPIAVVGPDQAAAGLEAAAEEGAFEVIRTDTREAALTLVEDREAYGALVAAPEGTELLIASGASPTVATLLQQSAAPTHGSGQAPPTVTDVAPLPEGDPRGAVFGAGALPLVLGGIVTAVLISTRLSGRTQMLTGIAAAAIAAGLALAGILQGGLDVLGGSYLANASVMALGLAAMASTIVGLKAWLGMPGIGVGALLMMLVGNPLSGVTSAPELLPLGWLGQLLPPGAMGSALRSTAYFDGAGAGGHLLVLAGWAVLGVALVLTAPAGRRRASVEPAQAAETAPAGA